MVEEDINKIGGRLARARKSMGLTFQQLADISGVAPGTIQKIEAGTMMPSVAVMMKVARGLHKKIGFFLDDREAGTEISLIRKRDRAEIGLGEKNFSAQSLTAEFVSSEMDGFILMLPPGGNSGEEPLHHRGEELVYCIRGTATFTIEGKEHTLGPGDSLYFKSELPHFWRNSGRSKAELILVCSLPNFSEKAILQGVSAGRNRRK